MKLSNVKTLITTGCSYTAASSNIDETPTSWAGHLARYLEVDDYVNLALPGGGNTSTSFSLTSFLLDRNDVFLDADSTMVVFNITDFDRTDMITYPDHYASNKHNSWKDILGFNWINDSGFTNRKEPYDHLIQKNTGIKQVEKLGVLALELMVFMLHNMNIEYRILLMRDYIHESSPDIARFMDKYDDKIIRLGSSIGMYEFCKKYSMLSEDGFHPSNKGYYKIYNEIIKQL
jgi:hypothetical protein